MGVTIENVAKAAGVSTATVSNVLNGRRNVGEKTRERVLALCAEIAAVHHAELSIHSVLHEGTTITIVFSQDSQEVAP